MAGGYDFGSSYLATVETTLDGQTFGALPDRSSDGQRAASCLVIIDDDSIFTCGRIPLESHAAYIFSFTTNSRKRCIEQLKYED